MNPNLWDHASNKNIFYWIVLDSWYWPKTCWFQIFDHVSFQWLPLHRPYDETTLSLWKWGQFHTLFSITKHNCDCETKELESFLVKNCEFHSKAWELVGLRPQLDSVENLKLSGQGYFTPNILQPVFRFTPGWAKLMLSSEIGRAHVWTPVTL